MDANMNPTVLDSSKYILWIHQKEDSNWQWEYYYTWGSLIKSISYADHDGSIQNGKYYLYSSGQLDSAGVMDHGKKNGRFSKYKTDPNDNILMIREYKYEQDSLIQTFDYSAGKNTVSKENPIDSLSGKDSLGTRNLIETEAEFPGGISQWQSYLSSHLTYPERALTKKIQGKVTAEFIVGKDGMIENVFMLKSVEYSIDQSIIKLIKDSPPWSPAIQNGNPVKCYKSQSLNYKLP